MDGQRVTYVSANLEGGVALGDAVDRIRAAPDTLALDGVTLALEATLWRDFLPPVTDTSLSFRVAMNIGHPAPGRPLQLDRRECGHMRHRRPVRLDAG